MRKIHRGQLSSLSFDSECRSPESKRSLLEYELLDFAEVAVARATDLIQENEIIIPERLGNNVLDSAWAFRLAEQARHMSHQLTTFMQPA